MLRHGPLADAEFRLDDRGQVTRGTFTAGKQLQDPPPYRDPQDVERVHFAIIDGATYISQALDFVRNPGQLLGRS